MKNSVVLLILDGWGVGKSWGGNAITVGETANYNKILREYPNTIIKASGRDVGLPGHEVGNSEVGHMNIGAGNIVEQDISHINQSISDGTFYENKTLVDSIKQSKERNSAVHLMGIVSDGGIHSHIVHLLALIKMCSNLGHNDVNIHAFTDGRDTPPYKGIEFINTITQVTKALKCGQIATIMGRDLLDRKDNWLKTQKAYEALVDGKGLEEENPLSAISRAYKNGESDEYIPPVIIKGTKRIKDNDTVIFFNFRSDRTRQLLRAFLDPKFDKFRRIPLKSLDFITFIPYGIERELGIEAKAAFKTISIANTIGEYFSLLNLKQYHVAETEKYAHVTFFINGNRNEPYPGEERTLVPSPDVQSYALKPEMSANEVKDELIHRIKKENFSLYLCNLANADMVGHTGDFEAALKAVETLDNMVKEITGACIDEDIPLVITADHGNIEQMVDPLTGQSDTEHTKNPVPIILVSDNKKLQLDITGRLGNVASTCLELGGFNIPKYLTKSIILNTQNIDNSENN